MTELERRIAAVHVVAELPPEKEDALAVLQECYRLIDYVFDGRLPLGNNLVSKSES